MNAGLTSIQHETLPEMVYDTPEGTQAESQAQEQLEVTSPDSLFPMPSQINHPTGKKSGFLICLMTCQSLLSLTRLYAVDDKFTMSWPSSLEG